MKFCKNKNQTLSSGHLLVLVLVFGSVFFIILSSFIGYIITQNQVVNFRYEQQRATEIAEAGLNYYKWYLSHYPGDVTNGTGLPGPYVHQFKDPEGGFIGEFSLQVTSTSYCGSVASIDISSTGFTYDNPEAKSTIRAQYSRPTVGDYSFITNSGVNYGPSAVITGPVHSNQGLRMDSAHNSIIGSGQATWDCNSSFGCNPTIINAPGVYAGPGANSNPGLFSFPVSPIDFAGLTLDLSDMRTRAINNGGHYFPPTNSSFYGYRVIFNPDSTFTVRLVINNAQDYWAFNSTQGWHTGERNVINPTNGVQNVSAWNNIPINSSCPLLFFEDKVWVEGTINQKVTLAAANLSSAAPTNIVINNNLVYLPGSNAGVLILAEDDIDIGLNVPNNMDISGIFIAQNGRFGRNHYCQSCNVGGNRGLPSSLGQFVVRNSLDVLGTIVSNQRSGVSWGSSGFSNRDYSFDQNQVDNPPPLTPETSDVYTLSGWQQDG